MAGKKQKHVFVCFSRIFVLFFPRPFTKLQKKTFKKSYRLAPENPYPVALNDCYSVIKYLLDHPDEFNADVSKMILAGDSAGNRLF
jgi:acetyl esterase/lipase